ncbi:hypothetical protein ACFPU0_06530 [Pseudomonas sp. GCM10022186]|uniref:hypothetical protein n=1 Tax=Pseudomonas sp. GCM10022186 TaxID=3252650 RepID=UPI00360D23DC
MRRRDIFKAAVLGGVASALPVASSNERLFGAPGSIIAKDTASDNKLRLLMSKGDIPVEVWEDVVDFSRVWSAVSSDLSLAGEFYADRESFLAKMGVAEGTIEPRSMEEKLLLASHDPTIRKAAIDGDYAAYLGRLKELGVFMATPTLRQRVDRLMDADGEALRDFVVRSLSVSSLEEDYSSYLERLRLLVGDQGVEGNSIQERENRVGKKGYPEAEIEGAQPFLFVAGAAIAVVAIGVATYVVAAVNVAVGLNIAASIRIVSREVV